MHHILIISGPTATGKTSLALFLAKKFNGDLISADSRQVYKGLDIITGKDIPPGFVPSPAKGRDRERFYSDSRTRIYGYDLVTPDQDWNAALFQKYALETIADIHVRGKLPIIVGGTGLYLRSLTDQLSFPPPDEKLRHQLASLSLAELQSKLKSLDPDRFSRLNHSDVNNPRRLIRHIEIATQTKSKKNSPSPKVGEGRVRYDILHLNLTSPLSALEPKIRSRVIARLDADPRAELNTLPKSPPLGFNQLSSYYQGKITRDQLIDLWVTAERQYAKRQLTWFGKLTNLTRLNIPVNKDDIVATIQLWYSQGNYGKK